jgi:AbrB family looped-hinge helix DNA binding protein
MQNGCGNGRQNGIENGTGDGKLSAMTAVLTLDSSGRLVLPKPFRDKMHLQAGAKLRLDMVGDKLELSQEEESVKVVKRGKRRVIVGWEGFDAAKAVREMRKDQVERLEAPFRK